MRVRFAAVAIVCALLLLVVPALAQGPDCTVQVCVSLPIIEHNVVPTEVPTPTTIPDPPMSGLVILITDIPSGFAIDEARAIENDEAAEGYPDPAAALAAFQAQGRETSWFVRFSSRDYLFSGPTNIADQAIRFITPEGAAAGQDYVLAEVVRERPDYQFIFIAPLGERTVAMRRTFVDQGYTWVQYFFSIRQGRYVTDAQVLGLASALQASEADDYAVKAFNRLPK